MQEQHPRAGLNTQHVLYKQQARAGRNTQLLKSEKLISIKCTILLLIFSFSILHAKYMSLFVCLFRTRYISHVLTDFYSQS